MTVQGMCDRREQHLAHEFDWEGTSWRCPGQHSQCRNCDDRQCMGCVFREYGHDCKNDCPDCCQEPEEKMAMSDHGGCGYVLVEDPTAVSNLVTVALPDPDSTRYEGDEHEPEDRLAWRASNWAASVWKYPEVQLSAVFDSGWETFEPFSIDDARALAAALLAAADAAAVARDSGGS